MSFVEYTILQTNMFVLVHWASCKLLLVKFFLSPFDLSSVGIQWEHSKHSSVNMVGRLLAVPE